MAKKLRVFVYGTLKNGQPNHRVMEGATFLGRATVTGKYRFASLGWYPAIVKMNDESHPDTHIGGEVYEIDSDILSTLDMIEGHPAYYCREKVMTSLGNKAWAYMLPSNYAERGPVPTLFWNQSKDEEKWINERETA